MRLESAMQMIKEVVDTELTRFFAKKRKEAERVHPALVELVDQVADVTLRGGKRIRPFLCWVGYQSREKRLDPRVKPEDDIKKAMLGLELFQTFALIHDDIMDADKTRRGGPTIHVQSGVNIAILAGDLALMWAEEAMELSLRGAQATRQSHVTNKQEIATPAERSRDDMLTLYQKMKEEVIYGQTLDVMRSIGVKDIEKSRADELKTAWYSVVRPLQIGSAIALSLRGAQATRQSHVTNKQEIASPRQLAGSRNDIQKAWERFGVPVGKLFQLRDDVLDGVVTEEACTKEAKDLRTQSLAALETLETSDEVRQLLVDFIQFVQNRNS